MRYSERQAPPERRAAAILQRYEYTLVAIAIAALLAWFFADILGPEAHLLLPPDTSELIYPLEYRIAAALKSGTIPLWNPFSMAGYPLAGYPQYGLFYPGNWPFWLWPYSDSIYPPVGYAAKFVAHVGLSGMGMYFLCRSALRLGVGPALFAAVVWMLLPNALIFAAWGNSQPAFAFWAFVIAFLLKAETEPLSRVKYSILAAIGLGLTILASPAQPPIQLVMMTGCLFLYLCGVDLVRLPRTEAAWQVRARFWRYALLGVAGTGLGAIALIPVFEFSSRATRFIGEFEPLIGLERMSFEAFTRYRFQASNLAGFFLVGAGHTGAGSNFLGVGVLALAGAAMVKWPWRGTPFTGFFLLLAVLAGLYMFNLVLPAIMYHIPGLNLIREPARYMSVFAFGIAVLAGIGLQRLPDLRWTKLGTTIAGLSALGLICPALFARRWLGPWADTVLQAGLVFALFPLAAIRSASLPPLIAAAFVAMFLSTVYGTHPRYPWKGFDIGAHYASHQPLADLKPEGAAPERVMFFRSGNHRDGPWPNPSIADIVGFSGIFGYANPVLNYVTNAYNWAYLRTNAWKMLNIRYIVTDHPGAKELEARFPGALRPTRRVEFLISATDGSRLLPQQFQILEVTDRPQGGFVVGNLQRADDQKSAVDMALTNLDVSSQAVLDGAPARLTNVTGRGPIRSTITWLDRDYNHIRLKVDSDEPGLLVLPELYFPGWVATVSGNAAPILRANGILRAVEIPRGESMIEMSYRPWSLWLGIACALAAALALAVWARFGGLTARDQHDSRHDQANPGYP